MTDAAIESSWSLWLLDRNRRGTVTALYLGLLLYPVFGVLDWLLAPPERLWSLLGTRALFAGLTFLLFPVVRSRWFDRHPNMVSSAYLTIGGLGISVMTSLLEGIDSPYYAGLSLILVASGLLFVWPARVVLPTHGIVLGSFLLPNLLLDPEISVGPALSNMFFLLATSVLVGVGQVLAYDAHKAQVANQVIVERTRANLEHAHAQLKDLVQFKSRFFQNITHEFKTPLTIMLPALEGAVARGGDDNGGLTPTQLKRMFRAAVQLLKLVDDLLDLARAEEAGLRLRLAEHDLVPYLRALADQVHPLAQRKSISLTFLDLTPQARVWCDLERVERVFVNLLANATKFTPEGGAVMVAVWQEDDTFCVAVADTGPGFPKDMEEKVFERFFQVDSGSTRRHEGAGIGLALAREIVLLHGGTIQATGSEGLGATFLVRLRRGRGHFRPDVLAATEPGSSRGLGGGELRAFDKTQYRLLDVESAVEKRRVTRDPDENQRKYTVLIVEDNPSVAEAINLPLQQKYRVFFAADGAEGYETATHRHPHLIITDYMMPGMDGIELIRKLRADPRTRYTPVILLTSRGDVDSRVEGVEVGATAYIAKPFAVHELIATVRRLLEDKESAAENLLSKQMDSLEIIASGLAHQINNPLNSVSNAFTVIRREVREAIKIAGEQREADTFDLDRVTAIDRQLARMFGVVDACLKRIADTVDLMRRYAYVGYSRAPMTFEVFHATRDVLQLLVPHASTEIRVEARFEGDGHIECVPEEVNQVLTNLVTNAVDALNEVGGGTLRVTGTVDRGHVELSVRDSGTGIDPEHLANLFTPFYTTKGPGHGMGMGLFICHRVVTSLKGTIAVTSDKGRGTEMVIRIPQARAALAAESPAS